MDASLARALQEITIAAIPLIFAITLHEAAHGYVARYFGDPTAYMLGRVSLNPVRHIDPVGTIAVPILTKLLAGGWFGWAKPVPVNFNQLRRPKQDMLWVALAGPAANLLMAFMWGVLAKLISAFAPGTGYAVPLLLMATAGVQINVILMVLNLVPLPPLDGGRIAVSLLPREPAIAFARIEPYGLFILVFLLFSGVLQRVIGPIIEATIRLVASIVGLT